MFECLLFSYNIYEPPFPPLHCSQGPTSITHCSFFPFREEVLAFQGCQTKKLQYDYAHPLILRLDKATQEEAESPKNRQRLSLSLTKRLD